jgi:hypothetical protein
VASDGRVWLGLGVAQDAPGSGANAQRGEGLAVWDPRSDRWGYVTRESSAAGLPGNTVTGVTVAGPAVWAATSYAWDTAGDRVGGGLGRLLEGVWTGWPDGAAGFATFADPASAVTGDVRSAFVDRSGTPWAGTWNLADANALANRWPRVDAVVNRLAAEVWRSDTFAGAGWVSALAQDTLGSGRVWAGVTRGHTMEYSAAGAAWLDPGPGGAWVREDGAWQPVTPDNSGLAARSVTAMALEPASGHLWLATENNGLSIYRAGAPLPAPSMGGPAPAGVDIEPAAAPSRPRGLPTWLAAAVLGLAALIALGLAARLWQRRAGGPA